MQEISPDEQDRAAWFLLDRMESETLTQIYRLVQSDGYRWKSAQQFGLGMQVRNLLRLGNFGWSDAVLDATWFSILADAAERHVGLGARAGALLEADISVDI